MAQIAFVDRLKMAWRLLIEPDFAGRVNEGLQELEKKSARPVAPAIAAERVHASGLTLLSAFQREGRLVDFLQQEMAGFSDEDVAAAARVVHGGCRKIAKQFFNLEPAVQGAEGTPMVLAAGFDSQRVRVTGNVAGSPPFKGVLKHHGWFASEVRMPSISESFDPRVIAPAEVELP